MLSQMNVVSNELVSIVMEPPKIATSLLVQQKKISGCIQLKNAPATSMLPVKQLKLGAVLSTPNQH